MSTKSPSADSLAQDVPSPLSGSVPSSAPASPRTTSPQGQARPKLRWARIHTIPVILPSLKNKSMKVESPPPQQQQQTLERQCGSHTTTVDKPASVQQAVQTRTVPLPPHLGASNPTFLPHPLHRPPSPPPPSSPWPSEYYWVLPSQGNEWVAWQAGLFDPYGNPTYPVCPPLTQDYHYCQYREVYPLPLSLSSVREQQNSLSLSVPMQETASTTVAEISPLQPYHQQQEQQQHMEVVVDPYQGYTYSPGYGVADPSFSCCSFDPQGRLPHEISYQFYHHQPQQPQPPQQQPSQGLHHTDGTTYYHYPSLPCHALSTVPFHLVQGLDTSPSLDTVLVQQQQHPYQQQHPAAETAKMSVDGQPSLGPNPESLKMPRRRRRPPPGLIHPAFSQVYPPHPPWDLYHGPLIIPPPPCHPGIILLSAQEPGIKTDQERRTFINSVSKDKSKDGRILPPPPPIGFRFIQTQDDQPSTSTTSRTNPSSYTLNPLATPFTYSLLLPPQKSSLFLDLLPIPTRNPDPLNDQEWRPSSHTYKLQGRHIFESPKLGPIQCNSSSTSTSPQNSINFQTANLPFLGLLQFLQSHGPIYRLWPLNKGKQPTKRT